MFLFPVGVKYTIFGLNPCGNRAETYMQTASQDQP